MNEASPSRFSLKTGAWLHNTSNKLDYIIIGN